MAVCIELLTRVVGAPTNPSVRLVLPSLRTGARRQDRALSGRELGILLPLHDTALIDMTSGRIIPLLSFSVVSSSDQSVAHFFEVLCFRQTGFPWPFWPFHDCLLLYPLGRARPGREVPSRPTNKVGLGEQSYTDAIGC